ncbi:MAG: murein biosynthesis integral membrane protein MurJ [Deltaproteobacteria bacterium RIFCSPLOWO2_02_FULL_47_10]|nr:MAG: murein biosynthesis integral membrane protein MurJ [Deltaproteobacteria bacterium RIFCSPLOWO2_02_FULL_47_10]
MSEYDNISRRAGIFGFFTLISRILGLIRDSVVAYFFGTKAVADAFYVAFRIPNLLRRLLAEGSLTMAFVPVFTEYLKQSREEGKKVADIVFTYLSILLALITVLGVIFAPWIVKVIAYGFGGSSDKFALTVYLTRIMFPYIFLVSLMAFAMGVLNTLKIFGAPAASPILLNLGIIAGASVFSRWSAEPTAGLAMGVVIGGVMQLVMQIPWLKKEGMIPRLNFNWRHPALKRVGLIMLPSIYGGAVYQINVMVITLLASFLPHGSVSYLWYADRVNEFPLGLFAVAVATASLPTLSDHAADNNHQAFKDTLNYSLRIAWTESIPAMVGIWLLAEPIVRVLFQRGQFQTDSTIGTVDALQFFALGIPFITGVRNIVPAYYTMRDAKTPVKAATITLIVNIVCSLILMKPMLHKGLAFSMTIASAVNFFVLIYIFRRRQGVIGGRKLVSSIVKTSIASLGIIAVVSIAKYNFGFFTNIERWTEIYQLFSVIIISVIIYLFLLRLIAPEEFGHFKSVIFRKATKLAR